MSATVYIPALLARNTGGRREVPVTGKNVRAVIEELDSLHPGIKQALCDDNGRLLRFLAVFVDGTDVRSLQGMETPVGPDAEIDIVAAIAGG